MFKLNPKKIVLKKASIFDLPGFASPEKRLEILRRKMISDRKYIESKKQYNLFWYNRRLYYESQINNYGVIENILISIGYLNDFQYHSNSKHEIPYFTIMYMLNIIHNMDNFENEREMQQRENNFIEMLIAIEK